MCDPYFKWRQQLKRILTLLSFEILISLKTASDKKTRNQTKDGTVTMWERSCGAKNTVALIAAKKN